MDVVVTATVCLGLMLVLVTACLFALLYPERASALFGDFSVERGAGIGGVLLFMFLILRLVYNRRKRSGTQIS
jgi:hypothetical protein